ncbi:hypothetical protein ACRRTK_021850 [Alexandromys fortis]
MDPLALLDHGDKKENLVYLDLVVFREQLDFMMETHWVIKGQKEKLVNRDDKDTRVKKVTRENWEKLEPKDPQ